MTSEAGHLFIYSVAMGISSFLQFLFISPPALFLPFDRSLFYFRILKCEFSRRVRYWHDLKNWTLFPKESLASLKVKGQWKILRDWWVWLSAERDGGNEPPEYGSWLSQMLGRELFLNRNAGSCIYLPTPSRIFTVNAIFQKSVKM